MKIIEELKNDLVQAHADVLGAMASEDCEGSFNCGSPEYHRHFMLEGSNVVYVAVLDVEYNRHDKQYYYVEDSEFRVEVTDK